MTRPLFASIVCASLMLTACQTTGGGGGGSSSAARKAMVDAIAKEAQGDYFVGRRYYKTDYKFWGYLRQPGQPWSTAKLVMMNENSKLAPDRAGGRIGSDNNYEYKVFGSYTGDTVYEPASNSFYPEFALKGTELLTTTPGPIYRDSGATNPDRRVIPKPY